MKVLGSPLQVPTPTASGHATTKAYVDEGDSSGVRRFASAAARDAAITAPVPGMRAYTADDAMTREYVVVNSVGYWAPELGTLVVSVYATTQQPLSHNTPTQITMAGIGRNLGGWWATSNTFNPKVPGWYECSGVVSFTVNATGNRLAFLNFNHPNLGAVRGSAGTFAPVVSISTVVPTRPVPVYFNGTTDYATVSGQHNAGSGITLNTEIGFGWNAPAFHATYLGQ